MFVSASSRTFSCALLLTLHSVVADAKPPPPSARHPDPKIKTLPVEPIVSGLNTGSRSVLLFSPLPTRFLLIVSSPNQKDLTGAVVFDQPPSTFNSTGATLFPPELFKAKWPKVTGATTSDLLFTVTDSSPNSYLVIANNASIRLLNLKTSDLTVGQWGTAYSDNLNQTVPVSSSGTMTFFTLLNSGTNILITKNTISNSGTTSKMNSENLYYFCGLIPGEVSVNRKCGKTQYITWNIVTGFVGSSFAYLVNGHSSIIKFAKEALQGENQPSPFTSIPFASFWRKGVIPTTTPPTTKPTTHRLMTPHLLIIYVIGGCFLFLLIASVICYFFCCSKLKSPPPTPSQTKGASPSQPKASTEEPFPKFPFGPSAAPNPKSANLDQFKTQLIPKDGTQYDRPSSMIGASPSHYPPIENVSQIIQKAEEFRLKERAAKVARRRALEEQEAKEARDREAREARELQESKLRFYKKKRSRARSSSRKIKATSLGKVATPKRSMEKLISKRASGKSSPKGKQSAKKRRI